MVKYTQTIRRLLPTNCLSVFGHFVRLACNGLRITQHSSFKYKFQIIITLSRVLLSATALEWFAFCFSRPFCFSLFSQFRNSCLQLFQKNVLPLISGNPLENVIVDSIYGPLENTIIVIARDSRYAFFKISNFQKPYKTN